MKEIIIAKSEDGIKLTKYLKKIFKSMPESLMHKLFRKKYFVVNGKKAKEDLVLKAHDVLKIYLGDDTFVKYKGKETTDKKGAIKKKKIDISPYIDKIIYEDDNIILYDKMSGMLSQGDKTGDISVNAILLDYVGKKEKLYSGSIVNRLDRNTSGIIIFAKTYIAAREISKMIKDQELTKRYRALVNGVVKKDEDTLINLFKKDEKKNIAIIKDKVKKVDGFTEVKLIYKVIKRYKDTTLLDINLITGKSHQIRAQLSHIGHPIVCDKKYMDIALYKKNVDEFKKTSQELCCYMIAFGDFENEDMQYLSKKIFKI